MVKWEGTLEYSDNKKHVFVEKTCKEVSNFLTEMRESLYL